MPGHFPEPRRWCRSRETQCRRRPCRNRSGPSRSRRPFRRSQGNPPTPTSAAGTSSFFGDDQVVDLADVFPTVGQIEHAAIGADLDVTCVDAHSDQVAGEVVCRHDVDGADARGIPVWAMAVVPRTTAVAVVASRRFMAVPSFNRGERCRSDSKTQPSVRELVSGPIEKCGCDAHRGRICAECRRCRPRQRRKPA